jgi:putative ABC transport system substrate-binding protein
MRRRDVLGAIAGAAAWPLAARAQQPRPLVGFLRSSSLAEARHLTTAFRQGLREAGFVEDHNVTLEFRSTEDRPEQFPAVTSDLIGRHAGVLVGDTVSALAAKAAGLTTPFVFASGTDPVRDGLVTSLNRPGGNITGVVFFNSVLGAKRLELLRQLVPTAATIGMLVNLSNHATAAEVGDVEAAAQPFGQKLLLQDVRRERDIEPAIADLVERRTGALLVGSGAFFNANHKRVVALAASHGLAATYAQRETVIDGGLMSYGASIPEAYRQVGIYTGRILKGEKPADLPVIQAVKFELALNLKTAKALGLQIPDRLLALADEVIE